jgi:hypothetical protein
MMRPDISKVKGILKLIKTKKLSNIRERIKDQSGFTNTALFKIVFVAQEGTLN